MILGCGCADHPAGHRFERAPGFPCWTISGLLRGAARIHTRHGTLVDHAPRVAAIRPRTPYRIEAGQPGVGWREVWMIVMPRPEWLPLLEWAEPLPGLQSITGPAVVPVLTALEEIHRLASGPGEHRLDFATNQLERALLLAREANPEAAHARRHPAVRAALRLIETHWSEPLDVAALAAAAACSMSHLSHLFAAELGASPMAYLEAQRIERAKHLLVSTALPVRAIAAMVGFANPFHFSTRFRRRTGRSPRNWRERPQ